MRRKQALLQNPPNPVYRVYNTLVARKTQSRKASDGLDDLPRAVRSCIRTARLADRLGIKTDEAWGTILGVMRGTINGRHLQTRLSAATYVLDQEIGRARQKLELAVEGGLALEIVEARRRAFSKSSGSKAKTQED